MSLRLRPGHRVFVFSRYVDMRAGFERLTFWIREEMKQNLLEGDLFVFVGKSRRLLKALCFDGTGLLLVSKRLNQGTFMKLEALEDFAITPDELDLLLRGSVIRKLKFGENALTLRHESRNLANHHDGRTDRERAGPGNSSHLRA